MKTYTKKELTDMTGATPRQLQHWDETRLVVPGWEQGIKEYSAREAVEVGVIFELRDKGLSLQDVRPLLRKLRKQDITPELFMVVTCDKKRAVSFEHSSVAALAAVNRARVPVILVHVGAQVVKFMPAAEAVPA